MVELAERLANPGRFGAADELSFTVIVPSLPGFTFSSQRPTLPADVATHEIWHQLMTDTLGFDKYLAHGGDLGAGTTSRLAAAHPEAVLGIHLMAVGGWSSVKMVNHYYTTNDEDILAAFAAAAA
mgnify:CR=1 FL=1